MNNIILIGGGGHCKNIIDIINSEKSFNIVGILDLKENIGKEICGVKIIGTDDELYKIRNNISNAFISVGSIGNVEVRKKIYIKLKQFKFNIPYIKDKSAIISENVKINKGALICKGVIVNADTVIGENCIINSGAIIEHDCKIGDFVHIAPGSIICGGVSIENNTHIGAGSTVLQYRNIGKCSIIGAGSVVTRDIGNNIVAYGNPAREVRINE